MALPLAALLPILTTLAPSLVRHVAGDQAGQVAQQAAQVVQAVAGTDDPAQIAAVLADPTKAAEMTLALARVENDAAVAQQRAILADLASARAHTVELARAGSPIAYGSVVVSVLVLIAFGATVWSALYNPVPEGSKELLLMLLGNLATMAAAVVAYWVGSSAGSARKDEVLRAGARMGNGPRT